MNEIQLKIVIKIIDRMKKTSPCDLIPPLSLDCVKFYFSKEDNIVVEISKKEKPKLICNEEYFVIYLNFDKIAEIKNGNPFFKDIKYFIQGKILNELKKKELEHYAGIWDKLKND